MPQTSPATVRPAWPIDSPEQADPDWFTATLGAAVPGARVLGVRTSEIGVGQVGTTVRFGLDWAADDRRRCPRALVGKFPATNATRHETASATGAYAVELAFYRSLAPRLPVRVPRCYVAEHDPAAGSCVLLIEEVAHATRIDQRAGADAETITLALAELVKLHAACWGVGDLGWLPRQDAASGRRLAAAYRLLHRRFLERYDGRLSDTAVAVIERFDRCVRAWAAPRPGPHTVLHEDYRLDNLLFGADGDATAVTVLDWQLAAAGPCVRDVAYLLGGSMTVPARREHETALLEGYLDAMSARVGGLDRAWAWAAYRFSVLAGLHRAVVSPMLVDTDERGDEMFLTMAERHAAHAADLDACAAVERDGAPW